MLPPEDVDEVTADLLLARTPAAARPQLGLVLEFLADLRTAADAAADAGPAPLSPTLAAVLRDGVPNAPG